MKLGELITRGGMTEVQALNFMSRARTAAYERGDKVVRVIRDGKVVEQYIGRVPGSAGAGSDSDAS